MQKVGPLLSEKIGDWAVKYGQMSVSDIWRTGGSGLSELAQSSLDPIIFYGERFMSISTVCDRFTITLKRYTTSPGASGQAKRTWTTDARTDAGLVASIRADMQSLSSEERGEYGNY